MIDIDKDYLITVDLKNSSVKSDRTIVFYNTDLNICNIFIKLICTDEDKTIPDDLIVELAVLKSESNEFKTLNATLISEEDLLYEVDLTTDYFDIVGKYECEIRISETVDGEMKCLTSESFNYIVKPNITTKLNNEISNDKNLPILEKLIKDVKELSLGIETNQVQMKTDEDLVGDNKTIVGAINQLREDFNSGISGGTVELTGYQKKNDKFLNTDEKTITGGINEVNNKINQLREEVNSGIGVTEELKKYQKKNDETLQTTSKEIVGAINEVNTQCEDITKYISPSSLDEFVELTKEGGLFYSLTSFPIVYNNNTYNVVGLIDSRLHSNGYSYYAFHKMWQFLINPDTKEIERFSSFAEYVQSLKLVGSGNTIKLMLGTKELSSITVSGGAVEPTPTPTPTTYNITNNLTNCTNSNANTTVTKNNSYVATITAVDGYTLTGASVNITMGGTNITSTSYNNGTINISSVTGDIVITITAVIDTDTVVGSVDSNNNISLTGLSAGTYTLKYEDNNGVLEGYDSITTMEVN